MGKTIPEIGVLENMGDVLTDSGIALGIYLEIPFYSSLHKYEKHKSVYFICVKLTRLDDHE